MRILLVLLLVACTTPNPIYCDDQVPCSGTQVCDLERRTCGMAADAAPGVDAAGGCVLDDECASGVCAPGGQCELASRVVYASPDGISAGACPATAPCELQYARLQLDAERSAIRLANGAYQLVARLGIDNPLPEATIVGGRGAVIGRETGGYAIEVVGSKLNLRGVTLTRGIRCMSSQLQLERVAFSSPSGAAAPWISGFTCAIAVTGSSLDDSSSDGIITSGGMLTVDSTVISRSAGHGIRDSGVSLVVRRSTIRGSAGMGINADNGPQHVRVERCLLADNLGGGLSAVSARFDVINNFVHDNGDAPTAPYGGIRLDSTASGNRLMHNTVTRNDCDPAVDPPFAGGVFCRGGVAANNLIAGNDRGNYELPYAQTNGTCDFTGSAIEAAILPFQLVSTTNNPIDLHIGMPSSPAVDAGIATEVMEDFDGQPRGDGMPDVGADEIQ